MKTNLFRVREIKKEKIVVEEEQLKHPFLFFLRRHKKIFTLIFTILGVSIIGIGLGITISLVGNTGDFDITYIDGSDKVDVSQDAEDEEVEKELLGNIAITDGVVLITNKFMTESGDIVTYYSDGTSLIITSKGEIKRVVPKEDGSYAIDENGKIDKNTIRKIVTSNTNTLDDGTIVTTYSDGSAEITKGSLTIFVRKASNIKYDLESINQIFDQVDPSGVSVPKKTTTNDSYKYTEFLDGTVVIEKNGVKYIVHNEEDVVLDETTFSFPNNNASTIKSTQKLSDGNTIDYYNDGSAIITDKNNDKISVRKSGDIVIKNDAIYEIYPNKIAYATSITTSPDGKQITYYDNAAAVIRRTDGTKEYIEDNSLIKYNGNKNITSVPEERSQQLIQKTLPSGITVTNFENNKTQIIEPDGKNYIIDTEDLMYDINGDIQKPETSKPQTSETSETSKTSKTSKTSGNKKSRTDNEEVDIDMTTAENEYNYSKSLENSSFELINNNRYPRNFRLVIEEVSNYSKFNAVSMATPDHEAAYYIRYQATLGNTIIPATRLSDKKIDAGNGTNTYVIYEGTLGAKATVKVNVILYVDYAPLDNSFQNKAFIGTIKLYYVEEDEEEVEE